VAGRCLCRTCDSTAADALSTSTEETLHAVDIATILADRLLSLAAALSVVNLLVRRWLLKVATIVTETRLGALVSSCIRLQ